MADDETGSGSDEEADKETLSTPRARAPWERKDRDADDAVRHSALVGFMSVPVGRRFPLRRSTVVLVVAFAGLATLLYFNPPQSTSTGSGVVLHTPQGDVFVPNATPVSTTTTTTTAPPATTTTTVPRATTTFPTGSSNGTSTSTSSSTSTTTTVSGNGGSGTTGPGNTLPGSTGTTISGSGTTTTTTSTPH